MINPKLVGLKFHRAVDFVRSLCLASMLGFSVTCFASTHSEVGSELVQKYHFLDYQFDIALSLDVEKAAQTDSNSVNDLASLLNHSKIQSELSVIERQYSTGPKFDPKYFSSLAQYLQLLMPELDLGAPQNLQQVRLSETQKEALFNQVYDIRQAHTDTLSTAEHLKQLEFSPENFFLRQANRIAGDNFRCIYDLQLDSGSKDPASDRFVFSLKKNKNPDDCIAQENPQLLWVNSVAVNVDQKQALLRSGQEEAEPFAQQRLVDVTARPKNGIASFFPFDLNLLLGQLNKAYEASAAGREYTDIHNAWVMQSLEMLRQQHAVRFSALRDITESLQDFFRAKGLILAKAYIPQQDFQAADGVVELAVVSGVLSDVYFRNIEKSRYSESVLMPVFDKYLQSPVTEDISTAYFRLNDIPGLTVQAGFFEPGIENGETRLNLGLIEEAWTVVARADNYGSEGTGENRFIVGANWFNLLGQGDSINFGVLQASSPSNTSYGYANYRYPVFDLTTDLRVGYEQTQYEAVGGQGGNKATSRGDLTTTSLGADFRWFRSKDFNLTLSLAGLRKQSDTTVTLQLGEKSVVDGLETSVDGAQFDIEIDYLSSALRALTDWRLSFFSGRQTDTNDTIVKGQYEKFSVNSDTLFLLPINVFSKPIRFNTKIQGIYSEQLLPTFERQALGGPYGVKAFKTADFTGDATAYINTQLVMDISSAFPWVRDTEHSLSLGVYGEASYGRLNGVGPASDSWAHLSGYGFLLYYRWDERLNIETSFTIGGNKKSSADFVDVISEAEKAFYISVNFNY